MTVQLVAENGVVAGVLFSTGCLLAELVTVSASLFLVDRMLRFRSATILLQWISLIVLLIFTVACFVAASSDSSYQHSLITDKSSPLILGFVMMIVNPVQLPFWLGWTAVLVEKKIVQAGGLRYFLYVAGSGAGSILASLCFILLGRFLITNWSLAPSIFYSILGILFFVSFVLQLRKIFERQFAV